MPTVVSGLPTHVLLLHVIVVLIPLGALFTVLSAVWPAARQKLGFISPLTCLIALVCVPVTTHAGEWLKTKLEQSGANPAIDTHASLGRGFLPYALALFVVSAAVWWLGRRFEMSLRPVAASAGRPVEADGGGAGATATATQPRTDTRVDSAPLPLWASLGLAVASVAVSAAAVWQLYRVGDSGAHAAWDYVQRIGK